jgi:hypothetical protein
MFKHPILRSEPNKFLLLNLGRTNFRVIVIELTPHQV